MIIMKVMIILKKNVVIKSTYLLELQTKKFIKEYIKTKKTKKKK